MFFAIWIAAVASNVGTWVQSVGEKWLMGEITQSPLLMSLIETGATLPMLVLSLPGGAIADIVDRRRMLLAAAAHLKIQALHEPLDLSPHHLQPHSPGPIHPDEGPILTVLGTGYPRTGTPSWTASSNRPPER